MSDFTRADAIALFDKLKTSRLLIAGGAKGACDYRAHAVALKLSKTGLTVKKIWCWAVTEGDDAPVTDGLTIIFDPSYDAESDSYGGWNFHVASLIVLPNGEEIVFDTVLYDGPVSAEQWCDDMLPVKGKNKHIKKTDCNVFTVEQAEGIDPPSSSSLSGKFANAASAYTNLTCLWFKASNDNKEPLGKSKLVIEQDNPRQNTDPDPNRYGYRR